MTARLATEIRAATYAAIKLLLGRGGQVHPMLDAAAGAFVVYFALPLIERVLG